MLRYIVAVVRWFASVLRSCPAMPKELCDREHHGEAFLVVGHRGSPTVEVENTLGSFRRAVEQEGANALELDVCLTADNRLVVWHDWDPDEATALAREEGLEPYVRYRPAPPDLGSEYRRRVSRLTLEELRHHFGYIEISTGEEVEANIPTLDEFMEWASGAASLEIVFLDIKIPPDEVALVPRFMEAINQLLVCHDPGCRFVFETVEPEVLAAMKRVSPDHLYTLDIEPHAGLVLFPEECSCMTAAVEHGNAFATPQRPREVTIAPWPTFRRIVQQDLEMCAQHNRTHPEKCVEAVVGFTVNEESEMECLIRSGIHGIQTDRPGLLRDVAERLGRNMETSPVAVSEAA